MQKRPEPSNCAAHAAGYPCSPNRWGRSGGTLDPCWGSPSRMEVQTVVWIPDPIKLTTMISSSKCYQETLIPEPEEQSIKNLPGCWKAGEALALESWVEPVD